MHIDKHNKYCVYDIAKRYYKMWEHVSKYYQHDGQDENVKVQPW